MGKEFKQDLSTEKIVNIGDFTSPTSNPLEAKVSNNTNLTDYSQELPRPKYDKDSSEIIEIVRILNNMAPISMPEYNFNLDEINGERYTKPDGTLLLVREYDSDVIRDYYVAKDPIDKDHTIDRILEHDKKTGRLRTKIEPITRAGSRLKTNITIFDEKINNKYTIIQLSEDGIVNNITEFTGKGKSFQTLFRNIYNSKPARYLEGRDSKENGFEMIDCIFGDNGQIARIRRYNNKKEVSINYTDTTKNIRVKSLDNK